jgi:hypothetical protein
MKSKSFDCYISLGDNCEAGLQFRRIGHEVSSIFRFAFIEPDDMRKILLSDFDGIFLKENLTPPVDCHMVRDIKTGLVLHSKLTSITDGEGKRTFCDNYNFDKVYDSEKNKVNHLVAKWRALVRSGKRVGYFFKHNLSSSREDAETLLSLFQRCYPQHNYHLLYIQPKLLYEPPWGYERLHNVYLDHLAPYDNAENGADVAGWNKIFREFPLKPFKKIPFKSLWHYMKVFKCNDS